MCDTIVWNTELCVPIASAREHALPLDAARWQAFGAGGKDAVEGLIQQLLEAAVCQRLAGRKIQHVGAFEVRPHEILEAVAAERAHLGLIQVRVRQAPAFAFGEAAAGGDKLVIDLRRHPLPGFRHRASLRVDIGAAEQDAQHVELARRLRRQPKVFRAQEFDGIGEHTMRVGADVAREIMHVLPARDFPRIAREQRAHRGAERRLRFLAERGRRMVAEAEQALCVAQIVDAAGIDVERAQGIRLRDQRAARSISLGGGFALRDRRGVERRLARACAIAEGFLMLRLEGVEHVEDLRAGAGADLAGSDLAGETAAGGHGTDSGAMPMQSASSRAAAASSSASCRISRADTLRNVPSGIFMVMERSPLSSSTRAASRASAGSPSC
jgi:hypothetical protein